MDNLQADSSVCLRLSHSSSTSDNSCSDDDSRHSESVDPPAAREFTLSEQVSSNHCEASDLESDVIYESIVDDSEGDEDTATTSQMVDGYKASTNMAQILSSDVKEITVKKLFPQFRRDKVLRFGRLFGPGKPSSLPQIWRGSKAYRKHAPMKSWNEPSMSNQGDPAITVSAEDCQTDDEVLFMKPMEISQHKNKRNAAENGESAPVAPWRFGPGAYWFDQMGVSETGENFDYGCKLRPKSQGAAKADHKKNLPLDKDAIHQVSLMVNQIKWEDHIIYDTESMKDDLYKKMNVVRQPMCGWIPTEQTRTYEQFMAQLKSGMFLQMLAASVSGRPYHLPEQPLNVESLLPEGREPDESFCILPPDNYAFVESQWENDIIWDAENMDHTLEPLMVTYDLTDESIVFKLPEDAPSRDHRSMTTESGNPVQFAADGSPLKGIDSRKDHHFTKKSQAIVGRMATKQAVEEEQAAAEAQRTPGSQMMGKDQFNLSNDEYYMPKAQANSITMGRANFIQHSIPAQNLQTVLFPTHLSAFKLRHFHRLPMRPFKRGIFAPGRTVGVGSLEKHIAKKQKERDDKCKELGGGEMFWMRSVDDLSAKDGEVVLAEFSEEHPPLLQQPGMASKIRNYYKRKPGKDAGEPMLEYGETAYSHHSPFLGNLAPGQTTQSLENNLYRAPVFKHRMPETDFLVIRTREGYFVRPLSVVFCVGQMCPQYEVPSPNSKRATMFVRDFLLAHIYRLFHRSQDNPRRLRMEDVKHAFPHYAESSVRKRLKVCADFKRLGTGADASYWVLREEFRLPSQEELRALITPEMCCAYYSMAEAEQRLKDAGYGEKYFFTNEDEEDDQPAKMDDEIKCAPWNTTRAFISAMKGKCLLDLTGVADPTGVGEGFSYVRVSSKPPKDEQPPQAKRTVTGTDADLRKLSLKNAKQLLKDFGVKEEEIKTLSRWEIIDVIRTLSTQQARMGGVGITKFARGNMRYNLSEMQQRYRLECQRIFDLQNRVLANTEILSSDEESSDGEDTDVEEMGKAVEDMLATTKKQSTPHPYDAEEQERLEFQKWLRGETTTTSTVDEKLQKVAAASNEALADMDSGGAKRLKIFRSYASEGQDYVTEEVVTRPEVIDAYIKVRTSRDETFIRHFVQSSQEYKEEKRKEKRRIQDRLRRLKKNEIKAKMGLPVGRPPKKQMMEKPKKPPKPTLKMKCSACGAVGHMRTNKNCPLYNQISLPPTQVAPTDEQMDAEFSQMVASERNLVSVEGTKLKFKKALVDHADKLRKKSLILKFPVRALNPKVPPLKLKKSILEEAALAAGLEDDQVATGDFDVAALHADETVADTSKSLVESTVQKKKLLGYGPFRRSPLKSPTQGTALSLRRKHKLGQSQRADYMKRPLQHAQRKRADPKVLMAGALENILHEVRQMPGIEPFLNPVSRKTFPDYYQKVSKPMDLRTIRENIVQQRYTTRIAFLADIKQIWDNSVLYNGPEHAYSAAAKQLFMRAAQNVEERETKLMRLEKAINPLLDSDETAFAHILHRIVEQLKSIPKAFAFHQPVDKRKVKDYYLRVKRPMDLGTIERNVKAHRYDTVAGFLRDVEQIYQNSVLFNGPEETSPMFTGKAQEIVHMAQRLVEENGEQLLQLEANIQEAKEKAMLTLSSESTSTPITSTSFYESFEFPTEELEDDPFESPAVVVQEEGSMLAHDLQLSDEEGDHHVSGDMDFDAMGLDSGDGREDEYAMWQEEDGAARAEATLEMSDMEAGGKLHSDLALSDSDDEPANKRVKVLMDADEYYDYSAL